MLSDLFSETSRQFGLAIGLLVVAVVVLARFAYVAIRELKVRYEQENARQSARIKELEAETVILRERLIEAIGAAEVGERGMKRLAGGGRRPPGGR